MTPAPPPTPLVSRQPAPGGEADPEARGTTGRGHAPCHHGELLQGVFLDAVGRRCAGLVTLPMAGPGSRAEFLRRPGTPAEALTVVPADRTKAAHAATLASVECARRAGLQPCGGEFPAGRPTDREPIGRRRSAR